jgi:hypothetical protein
MLGVNISQLNVASHLFNRQARYISVSTKNDPLNRLNHLSFDYLFLQNKCERYWPLDVDHIEMFGDIFVCVTACVNMTDYDLRYIELKKVKISM